MDIIRESFTYWVKGGILLVPIAVVCFLIWFYFLKLNYSLNRLLSMPVWLEDELQKRLAVGHHLSGIKQFLSGLDSWFCRALSHALEKKNQPITILDTLKDIHRKEHSVFERELVVLSALVASAPFLGLLGTVFGMITAFDAISCRARGTTEVMASGISQALITTQIGLLVALGGIFGVSLLRKKIRQSEVRFHSLQIHLNLGLRRRK